MIGAGSNEHGSRWHGYLTRGFLGPRDDRAELPGRRDERQGADQREDEQHGECAEDVQ